MERYRSGWEESIRRKAGHDELSRCGVYLLVNPDLSPPKQRNNILELERILTTRYRCGSHSLRIETGRLCNPFIPRDERHCSCNTGIQSLHHILFDCPLIADLHEEYNFTSIEEALKREDIAQFLLKMERKLGINSNTWKLNVSLQLVTSDFALFLSSMKTQYWRRDSTLLGRCLTRYVLFLMILYFLYRLWIYIIHVLSGDVDKSYNIDK